jgi:hypothetical protein
MSFDGIRGYVQLASGLGEATRARATEVAQSLLMLASRTSPADVASQVAAVTDDLLASAKANQESMLTLMRHELASLLDSSTALVKVTDFDSLKARVASLAAEVDVAATAGAAQCRGADQRAGNDRGTDRDGQATGEQRARPSRASFAALQPLQLVRHRRPRRPRIPRRP